MSDVTIHKAWSEKEPPERFDTRTFVTATTYTDIDVARGYIAYYGDSHTVESCFDGEYNFEYHDNQAAAYNTIEEEMQRIASLLEEADETTMLINRTEENE